MATENTQGNKLLKKLTIKEVVGGKGQILAYAQLGKATPDAVIGKPVPIMRIVGAVHSFRPGESDNGPYVILLGQFKAINLQTGVLFQNVARAILPDVIGDMVAAALAGGAEQVQFAVELDTIYDETAATFYRYEARSLLKPAESEPLKAIEALLLTNGVKVTEAKSLPAPETSAEDLAKQAAKGAEADKAKNKGRTPARV